MNCFSPRQIVAELDKYIIGQDKAKREVAVALRNRYRRSQLSLEVQEEITPKNIIMKGQGGRGRQLYHRLPCRRGGKQSPPGADLAAGLGSSLQSW